MASADKPRIWQRAAINAGKEKTALFGTETKVTGAEQQTSRLSSSARRKDNAICEEDWVDNNPNHSVNFGVADNEVEQGLE